MRFAAEPSSVIVRCANLALRGVVIAPPNPRGLIAFAHGAGSDRASPRDRAVALALACEGFATLQFDLLTREEAIADRDTAHLRFDIELLAERVLGALAWVARGPLGELPVGLFGASTGAAAALVASTRAEVAAVVARGGRPDLAGPSLSEVWCPTLFVVGGRDSEAIAIHRRAMHRMTALAPLHLVADAGHLFEEPGALRELIDVTVEWFRQHVAVSRAGVALAVGD